MNNAPTEIVFPYANVREIVAVNLRISTAYAASGADSPGRRWVLVDTGPAGAQRRLLAGLHRAGISADDIALIVLTHCHPDHAGGAAYLQRELHVPVAVHRAEADWAASGVGKFYRPLRPFGQLLLRTMKPVFPAVVADIVLDDGANLDQFGAPLTVLHSPGHTPGSISLLHHDAGQAMVGDLLAGGTFQVDQPALPYLGQDVNAIQSSVQRVLTAGPSSFLFGHGKPASAISVARRFGVQPTASQPNSEGNAA